MNELELLHKAIDDSGNEVKKLLTTMFNHYDGNPPMSDISGLGMTAYSGEYTVKTMVGAAAEAKDNFTPLEEGK